MTVVVETRRWWRFIDGEWKLVYMSSIARSNFGGNRGALSAPSTFGTDTPKPTDIMTVEFES